MTSRAVLVHVCNLKSNSGINICNIMGLQEMWTASKRAKCSCSQFQRAKGELTLFVKKEQKRELMIGSFPILNNLLFLCFRKLFFLIYIWERFKKILRMVLKNLKESFKNFWVIPYQLGKRFRNFLINYEKILN